ncbi:MAG: hypothetical protein C0606_17395 [Hyphomicrobiales bacterium]|nr:MAG: hypothetical protein C0606_17395 [Hyphomicrobiales bacterium]
MPKRIWLHIGMHKTASTFLQNFLFANPQAINPHGFLYPAPNTPTKAHHPLARATYQNYDESSAAALWAPTIKEIEESPHTDAIISSEQFEWLSAPARLKKLVPSDIEIKVVVYVRRQDAQMESRYQQRLQNNDDLSKTFEEFFRTLKLASLDLDSFLTPWEQQFGRENIHVRRFEFERFPEGKIELDFLRTLGIEEVTETNLPKNMVFAKNASLRKDCAEVMRFANAKRLEADVRKRLAGRMTRVSSLLQKISPEPKFSYMTEAMRKEILAKYEKSNQAVAQRYFGTDDLFNDKLPNHPVWDPKSVDKRTFIELYLPQFMQDLKG